MLNGARKSWFLQRWYHTLKQQYPAAYIDAWKNDFSDDPLLTVISGISEALKAYPNVSAFQYRKKLAKTGGRFLKQAGPALFSALIKQYSGVDTKNFKLDDFAEFAEKALETSLEDHNAKTRDIEAFKETIGKWVGEAVGSNAGGSPNKPMFVFIDELDRCRPTYAIELLETVKHLFDVKGLVFVIATNTGQLQHSIKAVYGSEFDAQRYLYRFFNRSFTLKKPDLLSFIKTQPVFKHHLAETLLSTCDGNVIVESDEVLANNLAAIAESFGFDLRTTLQWMDQLYLCFESSDQRRCFLWPVIAMMIATKTISQKAYESIFVENKSWEEAIKQVHRLHERGSSLIPDYRLKRSFLLQLKGESLLYAVKDNSLFEYEKSSYISTEIPIEFTLLARIAGMLMEFKADSSGRNYFIDKDSRRTIEEISATSAFFSTLKNLLIGHKKNRDSYLYLVDLASDLE